MAGLNRSGSPQYRAKQVHATGLAARLGHDRQGVGRPGPSAAAIEPGTPPQGPLASEVGIVIANHNNAAFVRAAIESAARQTVRGIRIVVVDDASTDESDEAIRECLADLADDRIRYLALPANLGQAGAIRRGLAELDTPFVAFLDSDDVWYESFVAQHLVAHLNADFPVALTYCDSHIIDSRGRMLAGTAWWFDYVPGVPSGCRELPPSVVPQIRPDTGELAYPDNPRLTLCDQWSLEGASNSMSSMMFRRDFVTLVLTPQDGDLRLFVDFYLSTFASLLTGAIAVHEALYAYRMHGHNKHSNGSVLGGTYNSSTTSWAPKRDAILQVIFEVMRDHAQPLRMAFGDHRYDRAHELMLRALEQCRAREKGRGRLAAALAARLARWFSRAR